MTNKRETPLFMLSVAARSNVCVARLTTGVTSVTASHYASPDWSVISGDGPEPPQSYTIDTFQIVAAAPDLLGRDWLLMLINIFLC